MSYFDGVCSSSHFGDVCSSLDCGDICGGLRTFVMCDRVRTLGMRVRRRLVSVRFVIVFVFGHITKTILSTTYMFLYSVVYADLSRIHWFLNRSIRIYVLSKDT
jgi:hypothetical protein